MSYHDIIIKEIQTLPVHQQRELLAFLRFLQFREKTNSIASEKKNTKSKPVFGSGAVKIVLYPDFDEPLEDFREYMS